MMGSKGAADAYGSSQGAMFRQSYGTGAGSLNDSPTRRFKKPHGEAKISSDLLGAGDDPMAKNQEFSLIANNPGQLMAMSFKKPTKAQSRYPPVIDPFSRTLAAPISSQRHYFSVCHRIGTNFTPSGKGFYIDTDVRSIKYKDVNDTGTKLDIVGNQDVEPADENEEYESLMNPKGADKRRIQARRISYDRYKKYVDNEIPVDVIAPIRQYWLSHIIELIPGDLHAVEKSRIEDLIDSMLNEINKDYMYSVKKSILDYILKDDNEMRRLGIQQVLNRPIDWGDDFYKGIEPNEEWKHNVMMARMLMSENLCICSHATLQLMRLWQDYENHLFIALPNPREKPVVLQMFLDNQETQMARVKNLLSSEWNKSAVDILREELENLDKDQTATFFESVATLMANQVRSLIQKSVDSYVQFFKRFKKDNDSYPTPKEIMSREFDPDTEFEDNFVILKLIVNNTNQIVFQDMPANVTDSLEGLVNTIVRQSEHIPRPENTIARSEKLHLWHVPEDDELVNKARAEISEILAHNMEVVEKALHVYDDYLFVLKEKQRVEHFLNETSKFRREDFAAEIARFEST
jgi:dynein heavy chain, axonemal